MALSASSRFSRSRDVMSRSCDVTASSRGMGGRGTSGARWGPPDRSARLP